MALIEDIVSSLILLYGHILEKGYSDSLRVNVAQFQVDYQTRKLYIVAIVLKYKMYFLIIWQVHPTGKYISAVILLSQLQAHLPRNMPSWQ